MTTTAASSWYPEGWIPPTAEQCERARQHVLRLFNQSLLALFEDADIAYRTDPRDCAAKAVRAEITRRKL